MTRRTFQQPERQTARPNHTSRTPAELRVAQGQRALVAIVGRPNVGKSTLFNRLAGARIAIVEDVPGVTRDRHYADADLRGRPYVLVDTGGFDPDAKDPVLASVREQVRLAVGEADAVVFVTDATSPLQEGDEVAARLLRNSGRPVVWVANKADSSRTDADAFELYRLGVDRVIPVSALHGRGMMELEEALLAVLPAMEQEDELVEDDVPRIAVVGRPNAGKSSLVNRLVGTERLVVDARPGTTTDAIDTVVERDGRRYVFVDTAGIRRKRSVEAPVEMTSVLQAIRAIERADVVVLVFDMTEGVPSDQDLRILSLANDRGKGLILALNKADVVDGAQERKVVQAARDRLVFAPWIPMLRISAKEGRGTTALLALIEKVHEAYRKRVGTSECNRFFEEVVEKHPPPAYNNRPTRMYYITQVGTCPPRFAVVVNKVENVAPSYTRYLSTQLRERFEFEGVPVRISYREKRRRGSEEAPRE